MIGTIFATVVGGYILHLLMKNSWMEHMLKRAYGRIKEGVTGRKKRLDN